MKINLQNFEERCYYNSDLNIAHAMKYLLELPKFSGIL